MKDLIPVPSKGTPIMASWGAAVANGMNALSSMSSPGMLSREGITGTGAQPIPQNLRDRLRSSGPRQFTLRHVVEKQGDGDNEQYRLKIEFYHIGFTDSSIQTSFNPVTWNGMTVPHQYVTIPNQAAWIQAFSSSWSSSLDVEETLYLNVTLIVSANGISGTISVAMGSGWTVSAVPVSHSWQEVAGGFRFTHAYPIGSVSASGSSARSVQFMDGPLSMVDALRPSGGGGSNLGSEGDADGTDYPMPFQYRRTDVIDDETGDVTSSSWSIVNNVFYWDGVEKNLSNYTPSATCTVYLVCSQVAPSSANPNPDWTFSIAETAGSAPDGGRVQNFKLYTFSDHIVTCDYRTTFLDLSSPHKVCYFKVSKQNVSSTGSYIELDASSDEATVARVSNGSNNSVEAQSYPGTTNFYVNGNGASFSAQINGDNADVAVTGETASLSVSSGNGSVDIDPDELIHASASFHKLTVHHGDGTYDEYDVLSDDDIDVYDAKVTVLTDLSLSYSTSTHKLTMTKTFRNLETGNVTTEQSEVFETTPLSDELM